MKFSQFIKIFFSIILSIESFTAIHAQKTDNQSSIVIENYEKTLSFEENKLVIESEKYRLKVNSSTAENTNLVSIYLNDDSKLKHFKAEIFNKSRKKIKSYSKSDLSKSNNEDGYSIFVSGIIYNLPIIQNEFPYFIEYEYNIVHESYLDFYFSPIKFYGTEVLKSELKVKCPLERKLIFKTLNANFKTDSLIEGNWKHFTFSTQKINALHNEAFSRDIFETAPVIFIKPVDFQMYNTVGTNYEWQDYGAWLFSLFPPEDSLTYETIQSIKNLTDTIQDTIGKIKSVYYFFQKQTRYVGIQEGIGKLKSETAYNVDKTKYGDCKGLTNYLKMLLKQIGVDAHYAIIGSGEKSIKLPEFSNSYQTNHAILFIPYHEDTIWLESTANTFPFGHPGHSNMNRLALDITKEGGKLVHTPVYQPQENAEITNANINVDNAGEMNVNIKILFSGLYIDKVSRILNYDKQNQNVLFKNNFMEYDCKDIDISFIQTSDTFPKIKLYGVFSGNLFNKTKSGYYSFSPNLFSKVTNPFTQNKERKNDIIIPDNTTKCDTIFFNLPENFKVEFLPENKNISNDFGMYKTYYGFEKNRIVYIRSLTLFSGTFSKERYTDLYNFYSEISNSDNLKIILSN